MSTVRPVPAPWKWTLGDPEPAVLSVREEVALLFFDPPGSGGPRDPERTGEAAQEARVLGRHARSPRGALLERQWESDSRGCGGCRHESDPSVCHWGMPVAYQGLASTVRIVKDDGDH